MSGRDVADAPGDEPAERLDVDRLAQQAAEDARGSAVIDVTSNCSSGRACELGGDGAAVASMNRPPRTRRRRARHAGCRAAVLPKTDDRPMTRDHGRWRTRMARASDHRTSTPAATGLPWEPYWARNDILEGRLAADEVDEAVLCAASRDHRPIGPSTRMRRTWPSASTSLTPVDRREHARRHAAAPNVSST